MTERKLSDEELMEICNDLQRRMDELMVRLKVALGVITGDEAREIVMLAMRKA